MPKYYTPARTNKTDKGKFKNSGQKSGKHGAVKGVRENEANKHADLQVKALTDQMFGQKKKRKVPARADVVGMGRS